MKRPLTLASLLLACQLAAARQPAPVEPPTGMTGNPAEQERPPRTVRAQVAADREPALTVNEPMYFVVGGKDGDPDTTARFQLSLKYRIFDREGDLARRLPFLRGLHFGYTQTSLWNLSADSAPFDDTSYRPSFFWEWGDMVETGRFGGFVRFGYEHESNGQGGAESRSIDTLFVMPAFSMDLFDRELLFTPKLYTYVAKGEYNEDIEDYRGYADLILRYGNDDSWVVQALYRQGTEGHRSGQIDLSIPLRRRIFARTGAYVYFQAFKGYGESLAAYNQESELGARIGIAFVR
ncbi:phospholipase A [Alkalilimnicola sp. S0819]|uniref:phospholipase A n=1 Tax=Alkalilimnicola sp. S0819 TaxID=2613922 RepID=UPI0012623FDA|nr:phospholipase A [Alkalilimnicola sp. S0819]KAB7627933.1 hypothetical protein F3N43_02865 [Alkalilimnicola sp. S0819]MPQ15571.1 hypothetical protein [Alkalilimnicola sp. S0819]